jgi:hypothetical protein
MLRGGKEKCLEHFGMKRPFHCCALVPTHQYLAQGLTLYLVSAKNPKLEKEFILKCLNSQAVNLSKS